MVILIWNSYLMYLNIGYKFFRVLVTSLSLPFSCKVAEKFIMKDCQCNWIGKNVYEFQLGEGFLTVTLNTSLHPDVAKI